MSSSLGVVQVRYLCQSAVSCACDNLPTPLHLVFDARRGAPWRASPWRGALDPRQRPAPAPRATPPGGANLAGLSSLGTTYTSAGDVRSRPLALPRQAQDPLQVLLQGQAQAAAVSSTLRKTKLVTGRGARARGGGGGGGGGKWGRCV